MDPGFFLLVTNRLKQPRNLRDLAIFVEDELDGDDEGISQMTSSKWGRLTLASTWPKMAFDNEKNCQNCIKTDRNPEVEGRKQKFEAFIYFKTWAGKYSSDLLVISMLLVAIYAI